MEIEQIYKLIEETEKINKEYHKEVIKRKEKRIEKEIKHKRKKFLIYSIPLSLILSINLSQLTEKKITNIYKGNKVKISYSSALKIKKELEQELKIQIPDEYLDSCLLLNAIFKNNNLSIHQKKRYGKDLIDIIKDIPSIQKEDAYFSLLKLNVTRTKRPFYEPETTLGKYIYKIPLNFYTSKIYLYTKEDNNVLEHELIHALLMNDKNSIYPNFLTEGITELITNEYFDENPYKEGNIYPFEILAVKMLCEIVTPQTVIESYTKGDIKLITNKLKKINPNESAKELINEIDKLLLNYESNKKIDKEKVERICNSLELYYLLSINHTKDCENYNNFYYYLDAFKCLKTEIPYISYTEFESKETSNHKSYTYIKKN